MSDGRRVATIIALGLLVGLGPFTIDMYLPAFPQLRAEFDVTDGQVQLTLAATTLGFAFGQLFVGPLSDRLGRRLPLLAANGLHVAASIGVALAPSIEMLSVLRVFQGLGAAGGAVVAMAMVRDLFAGRRLIVALSRLALVSGAAPVIAPVVGSALMTWIDWRGMFYVLAGYGVLMIAMQAIVLRETHPRGQGRGTSERFLARYGRVLGDRVYVGVLVVAFATWAGMFAYLSSSSLILQGVYGFSEIQFGAVFAICAVGVVLGAQVAPRISTRFGPAITLAVATAYMAAVGAVLLVVSMTDPPAATLIVLLFLYEFGIGLVMPSVQAIGLGRHGRDAGTAASLIGATGMFGGTLVGPVIGMFPVTSAVPMSAAVLIAGAIGVTALWAVVRPFSVPRLADEDVATGEFPVQPRP